MLNGPLNVDGERTLVWEFERGMRNLSPLSNSISQRLFNVINQPVGAHHRRFGVTQWGA